MADFLNDYSNVNIAADAVGGFLKGMQAGEDQKMKRLEFDAKMKSQDSEMERRKFQDALEMRKAGLQKNPDGTFSRNQEHDRAEFAARGMTPNYNDAGEFTGASYTQEYKDMQREKAFADPYGVKAAAGVKARGDAEQARKGFKLPPDKVLQVQQGAQIPTQLADIRKTLAANKDIFGPVAGRVNSMNPYDERSQTVNAQLRTAAQSFGRYMEGGVLRKEDELKYQKMFPELGDTDAVAANKLALVEKMLIDKQNADVSALSAQGYDTSGFGLMTPGKSPGILTKGLIKKGGLVKPDAAPAQQNAKPQTVIQNGVTYTLNPKTGQYE